MTRTVQGQNKSWQLSDKPIGSGDAGEVYAVTCIEQPDLHGVLKSPARIATIGTIQRQANQIAQECRALVRLDGLPNGKVHPPRLLDESLSYTVGTANYFIISETAQGESLASLLTQSRQRGSAFPHRVIITVLDALFDLFSRAHRAGVLWNDVKLEHIYWHNPSGEIAVIDWGNAIFLDDDASSVHRTPPRWQDYHQLVDTLGGFLRDSAPDLYDDLGWGEFRGEELDSPKVSILARRIAYQQQVLMLKEMEYQSLIRVILRQEPSLNNLLKIQEYIVILDRIGAPYPDDEIQNYGQRLIETTSQCDVHQAVKATEVIWGIFGESLSLSWHLVKEYFKHATILSHSSLSALVKFTFTENWSSVVWALASIAREVEGVDWWSQLIPVIRQKALGKVIPRPRKLTQSLLTWVETHQNEEQERMAALIESLNSWHTKGNDLIKSPFDYIALDILADEIDLPQNIRYELKRSFGIGEETIREICKGWIKMDWDAIPNSLRQLLCWDPERWGLLTLQKRIIDFQDWLEYLYKGPDPGENITVFTQDCVHTRPPIDRILGRPTWFKQMLSVLSAFQEGSHAKIPSAEVKTWCPWLNQLDNSGKPINKKET